MVAKDKSRIVAEIPAACADERTAVEFMEKQRWGDDPYCPRCESRDVYQMKNRAGERQGNYRWRCRDCDGNAQFTVRTGTVFEDSRIPLRHWCYAFWRACSSKKGVSALEIKRQTGLSYKSALFLMHRIRWAMADENPALLSGDVVADETYVGGKLRYTGKIRPKPIVMALVERDGNAIARPIPDVTARTLKESVRRHVRRRSRLLTDENAAYYGLGKEFDGGHLRVNHKRKEYVRGPATTNPAESFFALFKRGLNGTFHAVSAKHLHRYVSEFEWRWNHRKIEDGARTVAAIRDAVGKRLVYREPVKQQSS